MQINHLISLLISQKPKQVLEILALAGQLLLSLKALLRVVLYKDERDKWKLAFGTSPS